MLLYLLIGLVVGLIQVNENKGLISVRLHEEGGRTTWCIAAVIITLLNTLLWPITLIEAIIKIVTYIKSLK